MEKITREWIDKQDFDPKIATIFKEKVGDEGMEIEKFLYELNNLLGLALVLHKLGISDIDLQKAFTPACRKILESTSARSSSFTLIRLSESIIKLQGASPELIAEKESLPFDEISHLIEDTLSKFSSIRFQITQFMITPSPNAAKFFANYDVKAAQEIACREVLDALRFCIQGIIKSEDRRDVDGIEKGLITEKDTIQVNGVIIHDEKS
jgi:hypothetical protein